MVRDRSSICGRASESNSPPERYLPDLVIAAGGEERRRMLVLQLILAGDANFDTFPLWSFGQRLDIAASSYREKRKLLLIQRRGSCSNRLSSLPRIYGFMKGDSTAKTCDPSTVKRVSGQQSRSGLNSAVVIFRLEIESHNYAAAATSHFAARCAGNGCN